MITLIVLGFLIVMSTTVLLVLAIVMRAAGRNAQWNGNRSLDMRATDPRDSGPVFWGDSGGAQNGAFDSANDSAGAGGQWSCDNGTDTSGASSGADSCCVGDFGGSDFSSSDFGSSDCGSSGGSGD